MTATTSTTTTPTVEVVPPAEVLSVTTDQRHHQAQRTGKRQEDVEQGKGKPTKVAIAMDSTATAQAVWGGEGRDTDGGTRTSWRRSYGRPVFNSSRYR